MAISDKKLPFDGNAEVLSKLTGDYLINITSKVTDVKSQIQYEINCNTEPSGIERSARKAVLARFVPTSMIKKAFDTRNINQEKQRNPRGNLQFWHRSDPFISKNSEEKLSIFFKLMSAVKKIKSKYEYAPEFFNSYVRILYDHLERILRVNINDRDYSDSQLAYLEQLLFARYRIELKDIVEKSDSELEEIILSKDEDLVRRGFDTKPMETRAKGIINNGRTNNYDERILALLEANLKQHNHPILVGVERHDTKDSMESLFGRSLHSANDGKANIRITIHICDEVEE